jgi:hypothetical protein
LGPKKVMAIIYLALFYESHVVSTLVLPACFCKLREVLLREMTALLTQIANHSMPMPPIGKRDTRRILRSI